MSIFSNWGKNKNTDSNPEETSKNIEDSKQEHKETWSERQQREFREWKESPEYKEQMEKQQQEKLKKSEASSDSTGKPDDPEREKIDDLKNKEEDDERIR